MFCHLTLKDISSNRDISGYAFSGALKQSSSSQYIIVYPNPLSFQGSAFQNKQSRKLMASTRSSRLISTTDLTDQPFMNLKLGLFSESSCNRLKCFLNVGNRLTVNDKVLLHVKIENAISKKWQSQPPDSSHFSLSGTKTNSNSF